MVILPRGPLLCQHVVRTLQKWVGHLSHMCSSRIYVHYEWFDPLVQKLLHFEINKRLTLVDHIVIFTTFTTPSLRYISHFLHFLPLSFGQTALQGVLSAFYSAKTLISLSQHTRETIPTHFDPEMIFADVYLDVGYAGPLGLMALHLWHRCKILKSDFCVFQFESFLWWCQPIPIVILSSYMVLESEMDLLNMIYSTISI